MIWPLLSAGLVLVGLLLAIKGQVLANQAASHFPGGLNAFGERWDPPFVKFARALDAYEKATRDHYRKPKVYALATAGLAFMVAGGTSLIGFVSSVR